MRRQPPRKDLGEAISIEDALSLMTVVFVLFILFMVPLVNIDRLQLVRSKGDEYFQRLSEWIAGNAQALPNVPYASAFGLDGHRVVLQVDSTRNVNWVEALNSDGSLTVVEHAQTTNSFIALVIKGHSEVVTYRFGSLRWSGEEKLWFTTTDSIDYGNRPELQEMQQRLRAWTLAQRGF